MAVASLPTLDGDGPLDVALLKQLQQPLFQPAREEHERIGDQIERFAGESLRPADRFRDLPMRRIDAQNRPGGGRRRGAIPRRADGERWCRLPGETSAWGESGR